MIPLARRYSLAALALCAVAALAIWLHRTTRATFDPCSGPDRLRHLDVFGAIHLVREINKPKPEIHSLWVEGELPSFAPGRRLRFRLVRSVDPFALYGNLGGYFYYSSLPEDLREIRALDAGADVLTVHRHSDSSTGDLRVTQYFFAQGIHPVAHPFPGGLSVALDQLVRGTQPVTLFLVSGVPTPATRAAFEERSDAWLASAWSEFRRVCGS